MEKVKIEDYELEYLSKGRIYINRYGTDLMPLYILNTYWKAFFFDVSEEMHKKGIMSSCYTFDYFKTHYADMIKNYQLNIDIKDYVEISDYILFDEWLTIEGNGLLLLGPTTYLVTNVGA